MLSQVERCKERLLSIGPQSERARRQIISSVMDYWREKPGVGVNVVDKLLNYTILTPNSVIMWALSDQLKRGEGLVLSHVFELVSNTVAKVTNRVRQIVITATRSNHNQQPGSSVSLLPADQLALLEETVTKERNEMMELFGLIEDVLVGVASGSADEMAESADQDGGKGEAMLRGWGARWLRVFRRKMAVEEAWIEETMEQGRRRQGEAAATVMEGVDAAAGGEIQNGGDEDDDMVGNGVEVTLAREEVLDVVL